MYMGMKSVMVFDPKDSDEETATKWADWLRENKISAVGDKYVPGVEDTRKLLNKYKEGSL